MTFHDRPTIDTVTVHPWRVLHDNNRIGSAAGVKVTLNGHRMTTRINYRDVTKISESSI